VIRVIERSSWRSQPWKNGAGTTHEVWLVGDPEDYELRVSVAEVTTSGPFSRFPGYRRWSFLVGTAPIELAHPARLAPGAPMHLIAPGDHVELPGDAEIKAELHAGPTHLLNILALARGRAPTIVAGFGPTGHPVRFVFALVPRPADGDRPELDRFTAVLLDPPAITDTTDCIWIT
jgi:environmental stress-induced protein Ves